MRRSIFSRIRPRFDSCIRLFRGRRLKSSARLRSPASRDQRLVSLAPTPEHLETRLALAVDVAFTTPTTGAGERWSTILVNEGSDAYMKMVATPQDSLFVADNASFANRQEISGPNGFNATVDTLNVFNGQTVTPVVGEASGSTFGMPVGYPWQRGDATAGDLQFVLPTQQMDFNELVEGVLDLNDGSANDRIVFDNLSGGVPSNTFRITAGPGAGGPLQYFTSATGGADPQLILIFDNDALFGASVGSAGVPTLDITYDAATWTNGTLISGFFRYSATNLGAGVPDLSRPTVIDVLDESQHQIIPGTLRGTLELDFGPSTVTQINFQVQEIFDSNLDNIDLSFWDTSGGFHRPDRLASGSLGSFTYLTGGATLSTITTITTEQITVDGNLNQDTGELTFFVRVNGTARPFSVHLSDLSMGVRDIDPTNNAADPFGLTYDTLANDLTLYPGQTFSRNLNAELPSPDSAISIESPIVIGQATGSVVLNATEIYVNAPVRAPRLFQIPSLENSSFGASTEIVTVAAALSSNAFDMRISDDPDTTSNQRGRFTVTQTGTISDLTAVLDRAPDNLPQADSLFLEAVDSDIYLEGRVVAAEQNYLIRSPQLEEDAFSQVSQYPDYQPYYLTTRSRITGSDTGSIEGTTVGITLGNDLLVLDPSNYPSTNPLSPAVRVPSTAYAVCDINTNVASLRVQASDRQGDNVEQPFPYKLTVREDNDLNIDAVAASSFPIDIFANGEIDLLAKVESAGDVRIESTEQFVVGAPISTRFGTIELVAPQLTVRNSVRVLDGVADEREWDIRLETTNGGMLLEDAVTGINRVILDQTGGGPISGNGRVFADVVEVFGDSSVDIKTEAARVAVRTEGDVKVEENTYGVFEIRDSKNVTLVANGYDQVVRAEDIGAAGGSISKDRAYLSPALFADVYDTETLTVSAPNGSVDVYHYGDTNLSIGDPALIASGREVPMSASGSVNIRSTLSAMSVYDAPSAAGNARSVRLATTRPLVGTYLNQSPGVVPSRLERVRITRENSAGQSMAEAGVVGVDASFTYARELDGVDVTTLRVGDDVLVKNGSAPAQGQPTVMESNGIYKIVGITYPIGDTSVCLLDLVRRVDSDTTDELAQKHYVQVFDGRTNIGTTWTADGTRRDGAGNPIYGGWGPGGDYEFVNVFDNDAQRVPVRVQPVVSRAGFINAVATSTVPLLTGVYEAVYDHNTGTIDGVGFDIPLFDGVAVEVGERVLVKDGASDGAGQIEKRSAGLYVVVSRGNGVSTPWQLKRYEGIDEDGDGLQDRFYTGLVAVDEGNLRTAVTGEMFEISLDSLGFSPLRYQPVRQRQFGQTTAPDSILEYQVDIGSNDPLETVTFIVSTENGVNNATGSFGRMLGLYQGNVAVNERTLGAQPQTLTFDPGVGTIELQQELPPIYRNEVDISAPNRVTLDGRYITRTWEGRPIRSGSVIAAVGPVRMAEQFTERRLSRSGQMGYGEEVYGLQLTPTADEARISNLAIGGFNNGSGILVQGAGNVLIRDVVVGRDAVGAVLGNKVGVELQGAGVEHTTLRGLTVVNSQAAGVLLGTSTNRVHVVGSLIGAVGQSNARGISLQSESVIPNYIGSAESGYSQANNLNGVVEAVDPITDEASLLFAVDTTSGQVRPGMVLYDSANRIVRTILAMTYEASGTDDPTDDFYRITVSDASKVGAETGIGNLVANDAASGQAGYLVESGKVVGGVFQATNAGELTERDYQIRLPSGISERDVFVGQQVSAAQAAFQQNTTITRIDNVGGDVVLTLSNRILESRGALLLLGSSGANQIVGNGDGIVIGGNSSSIVDTMVQNSIYDGIRVERTDNFTGGLHVIGDALGTVPGPNGTYRPTSLENVMVTGSGLVGIRFTKEAFAALGAIVGTNTTPGTVPGVPADGNALADYAAIDSWLDSGLRVRGNYFGYNPVTDGKIGNGPTGVENIVVDLSVGDSQFAKRDRIAFLLRDDSTPLDDNMTPGVPSDDPPFARLSPAPLTSLDSQFNQYAQGDGTDTGGGDDREVTPPRRPVVR